MLQKIISKKSKEKYYFFRILNYFRLESYYFNIVRISVFGGFIVNKGLG